MAATPHLFARFVGRADRSTPPEPATFVGVATLTTSRPDLHGPYTRPVSAELLIHACGDVTVRSVQVDPAQLGSVTCVIALLPKTGHGRYVAGKLQLTLGLEFCIDVLQGADSEITLTLTTEGGALPDAEGRITVAGTGTFQKGYLGGRTATLTVTGTITRVEAHAT
jgi:hypothetical protein